MFTQFFEGSMCDHAKILPSYINITRIRLNLSILLELKYTDILRYIPIIKLFVSNFVNNQKSVLHTLEITRQLKKEIFRV